MAIGEASIGVQEGTLDKEGVSLIVPLRGSIQERQCRRQASGGVRADGKTVSREGLG